MLDFFSGAAGEHKGLVVNSIMGVRAFTMRARRRKAGGGWFCRSDVRGCEDREHLGVDVIVFFTAAAVGISVAGFKSLGCRSRTVPAGRRDRRWVAVDAAALGVVEAVVFVDPHVARRPYD